jgi:hypothetical protein
MKGGSCNVLNLRPPVYVPGTSRFAQFSGPGDAHAVGSVTQSLSSSPGTRLFRETRTLLHGYKYTIFAASRLANNTHNTSASLLLGSLPSARSGFPWWQTHVCH